MVSPNKRRTDRAIRALKLKPHRSALKKNHLSYVPKKKLCFASFMSYLACSCYEYPASPKEDSNIIQAGYSCRQVKRHSGNLILPTSLQITDASMQFGMVSSPIWEANQISTDGPNPELMGRDPISARNELISQHNDMDFSRLIDDMADQFWHCDRCLSMSHHTISCTGKIRCKGCYRYGHAKSDCWRVKKSFHWVVKTPSQSNNIDSRVRHKEPLSGDCDTSQRNKNSSSSMSQPPSLPMANFPVDPHKFVPHGFDILEPWGAQDRPARMYLTTTIAPPKRHESWARAQVDPRPEGDDIDQVLNQLHDHMQQNLYWDVISFVESAVGIGLFRMQDSITRDLLVTQPALNIGHGRLLTFVRHDEGANFRSTVYTRLSWIMLLDLPLDYGNEEFLREAFAKFGKMRGWIRDDPETARTLVRCAYTSIGDIPMQVPCDS
jgi:hypothetical protein